MFSFSLSTLFNQPDAEERQRMGLRLMDEIRMYRAMSTFDTHDFDRQRVLRLVKRGADLNVRGVENSTPAMWIAQFCDDRTINAMLDPKRGADLTLKDDNGMTVLNYAGSQFGIDPLTDPICLKIKAAFDAQNRQAAPKPAAPK